MTFSSTGQALTQAGPCQRRPAVSSAALLGPAAGPGAGRVWGLARGGSQPPSGPTRPWRTPPPGSGHRAPPRPGRVDRKRPRSRLRRALV